MKKILAVLFAVVLAFAALSCVAFADAEPIVYDFTSENASPKQFSGTVGHCWDGLPAGTSSFDATEKAWKLEVTKDYSGAWAGCYEVIRTGGEIDFSTYLYIAICYKENFPEGQGPILNKDGAAHVEYLPDGKGAYGTTILKTALLGQGNDQIIFNLTNQGDETGLAAGSTMWIKYVAFFATKAEAEAFDIEAYNGSAAPEASQPEASEPEASQPEASEAETSEVENSQSEKPNTNTSDVAIISGAILLCAAAATVVAVSRKRK